MIQERTARYSFRETRYEVSPAVMERAKSIPRSARGQGKRNRQWLVLARRTAGSTPTLSGAACWRTFLFSLPEAALAKGGICTHGWLFAPPYGQAKCNDCGKVFKDRAHAYAERYNRDHGFDDDDSAGWHHADRT